MVDQVLLSDTLQKINTSLNKRFEKDVDLYISRQDEYEIKQNFCKGAYGGVIDIARAKGISHNIVVKVLLRNAGVIKVTDIGEFKKKLQPIFKDADYSALTHMMEDIFNNNVYMQKKVRHVLFTYYMGGMSAASRVEYWKSEIFSFDTFERIELYKLILDRTKYELTSQNLKFKTDFMNDAFQRFPSILKDKNAMLKLKDSLDAAEQVQYFGYLSSEMKEPSIDSDVYDFVLASTYASYGETAFNDAVSQIRGRRPSRRFKQYIKVICKVFWTEMDDGTLIRMFDMIFTAFESDSMPNNIKREINAKVWKIVKKKETLYHKRQIEIDRLLSEVEETDKNKYMSFDDIEADLKNENMNRKSISYFWVNMKSSIFEESLEESFTKLDVEYIEDMREVYLWLFNHSMSWGGTEELNRMCEKVALSLYRFAEEGRQSLFYDVMDDCWLKNVIKYKLRGKHIEKYMFTFHFEKVKEWQ